MALLSWLVVFAWLRCVPVVLLDDVDDAGMGCLALGVVRSFQTILALEVTVGSGLLVTASTQKLNLPTAEVVWADVEWTGMLSIMVWWRVVWSGPVARTMAGRPVWSTAWMKCSGSMRGGWWPVGGSIMVMVNRRLGSAWNGWMLMGLGSMCILASSGSGRWRSFLTCWGMQESPADSPVWATCRETCDG